MNAMLMTMNIIITRESPAPRFQLELAVNSCSMMLPIRFTFPPPSILETANVVREGTNTMVTPLTIPGTLRGTMTLAST
jgi:hypothetical protein